MPHQSATQGKQLFTNLLNCNKMKKTLFLLFALAFAFMGNAQRSTVLPLAVGDTIVNGGTSSKVIQITTAPSGIVIQVNLNRLSGTGAGTVQLQGSLDNVNWTNLGAAYTITNVATQSAFFTVVAPVAQYLRALCTGAGAESVVQTVLYRSTKYQAF